ncbi:MAG: protein translocase subunit SecF [Patescibacteria group bacterium]|nr:protein translocase subunit SecF [Patescibacteria group bacterium]
MMYKIIEKKKIWFIFSGLLILISLFFIFTGGLKLGIDFTGGTLMQINFKNEIPETNEIRENLNQLELGEIKVQKSGQESILLRLKTLSNQERNNIITSLEEKFGPVTEESFESIGPTIGQELKQKAFVAIALVLVGIIIYISWAFRKIKFSHINSPVFGFNAIIALIHDILITLGVFAALGFFFNIEVDIFFVTALLTILGFSVHDTIVVFDRVREGLTKGESEDFDEILNKSINQTIVRSLNTSITTLLVLLALLLFGGESIRFFILALIIGVIIGTYSSIFIASPLLSVWYHRKN